MTIKPTRNMQPIARSRSGRIKLRLAWFQLFGICITSCSTISNPPRPPTQPPSIAASAPTPVAGPNWKKVRSEPPTWYPRGTPADVPTDFRSGEWVLLGDPQGTRYFIPLKVSGAIPRQTLVNEALAARSARKKWQNTVDSCGNCIRESGNIVVGLPLTILALYGAAASSPNQTIEGSDFELIQPFPH